MDLIETFKSLINQGEELRPKGGTKFKGYNGKDQPEYVSWRLQVISALNEIGKDARPLLQELDKDKDGSFFYENSAATVLGVLKAGLAIAQKQTESQPQQVVSSTKPVAGSTVVNEVFIVYGHDETLLQHTARFVERLGINPIILSEKAGKGQTIIEKIETNSSVSFAIVLLTPDDIGKGAKEEGQSRPRARQNVILELGYFLGKMGRPNVVVLYDESVELPSDYRGVEYIKIDTEGAWKFKLAREMKEAGLTIDMNKAI